MSNAGSYVLMVSHDCGIHYREDCRSVHMDRLLNRMRDLDNQMLRWYVIGPDGETCYDMPCALHASILGFMKATR